MKKKLRKITVSDKKFLWRFHSVWDQCFSSQVQIVLESDKNVRIIIHFKTRDTFTVGNPLNEGLPVTKNGTRVLINLNQPGYIAELIAFLLDHKINLSRKKHHVFDNGNALLLEMGYQEIENYLIDT